MGVTVLIVDDHVDFRRSVRRLFEAGGFEVIGEAGDVASALELVHSMRPHVVLLDIQLPDGDGIDAVSRMGAGGARIVLASSRDATAYGDRIASSGARGFIRKADLTVGAVRALVEGAT
ncbi:MAG TPA: response regulator transcription factor [Candidatus Dormibacteraeota bacterium]|nr:response regulator transcription factor [Candidatus Dormibacteraeota bacterium]